MKVAAGAAAGFFVLLFALVVVVGSGSAAACGSGGAVNVHAIPKDATSGPWDSDQMINAGHIMNAATAMNLSMRAEQIGVMTAIGESTLVNIGYGAVSYTHLEVYKRQGSFSVTRWPGSSSGS